MSVDVFITDGLGKGRKAHVHALSGSKDEHAGLLVLNERFLQFAPALRFFRNESQGTAMNQNVSFTGSPEVIFDGQSTSADSGTTDGTSAGNLVDAGQNFTSTVAVGMGVHNSTDDTYAHVNTVTDNENLALSADIMVSGEAYAVGNFWIPTANAGTWDFSASDKVTISSANNNEFATFDDGGTIDMSSFVALTGKVDLDTYDPNNHSILIQFGLAGVAAGNSVNLNNFINTGDFSEQSFVISKDDLGISTVTVDEMTITIVRSGGAKPTIKFDDFQIEATGTPLLFQTFPPPGRRYHIEELVISLADNITGITAVAGATENATVENLSYDKLLGVTALTNGITFQVVRGGEVFISASLKQLGNFLDLGSVITNHINDGTNAYVNLVIKFPEKIILESDGISFMSFSINDNLSGLVQFTAATRGVIEI